MKRFLSLIVLFLLFSCSETGIEFSSVTIDGGGDGDDVDPTSEVYFTYKVYERTIFRDNWIVIHDENGEILDYTRYENGDELIFEKDFSLLTDNIAVTLFTHSSFGLNQNFKLSTTLNIPIGTVWDNEPIEPTFSNPIGNFDLTLSNMPEIIGLYVSNENSLVSSGAYTGTPIGATDTYNYTTDQMSVYPENEYFITFIEDNEDFKYHFLEEVQDGDDLMVDYSEFQFFDNYLDVDLPASSYYHFWVNGFEDYQELNDENGYVLGDAHYTEDGYMNEYLDRNPLRIGYLNRFDFYRTELDVIMDSGTYIYNYKKVGDQSTSINIPDRPLYSTVDNSIQNFDFTVDVNYDNYTAYWESDIGTYDIDFVKTKWDVTNPSDSNYFYGVLPDALFLLYLGLDISNLLLEEIDFNLNVEEKIKLAI